MYKGVSASLLVLSIAIAGCGGDDDDAVVNDSCSANMKSVPCGTGDPCPQDDPHCPATMYSAVATCGADGHWMKDAATLIMCACVPKGGAGAAGNAAATKLCGNGKIDATGDASNPPEQCDGAMLNLATCATLMPGTTGVVSCDPLKCSYITTMCTQPSMSGMGGNGAGQM